MSQQEKEAPANPSAAAPIAKNPTRAVSTMTKAQASQRYVRLTNMASCVANEDGFYSQYLGVARNILTIFSVAQSGGNTPAVMPDPPGGLRDHVRHASCPPL